jgi:hypothetical protein
MNLEHSPSTVHTTKETVNAKEVITNYYTGEKWFLVCINGNHTYVNEDRYNQIRGKEVLTKPKIV